ncbi:6-hydroxy-D-nicotine oxidase [Ilyonectria robusta]
MSYPTTNTLFNSIFEGPGRKLMRSCSMLMPLDAEITVETGRRRFLDFITSHNDMTKPILAFEFFPAAAIRATPHEATAFANGGEHYLGVMGLMYDVASRDGEVRVFKRELSDYMTTTCGYDGKRAPGDPVPFYLNLEHESMSPEDAFGDHVQRLRELQRKYDAENVFHEWHGVKVEPKPSTGA